jgi:hypothetical protein
MSDFVAHGIIDDHSFARHWHFRIDIARAAIKAAKDC